MAFHPALALPSSDNAFSSSLWNNELESWIEMPGEVSQLANDIGAKGLS